MLHAVLAEATTGGPFRRINHCSRGIRHTDIAKRLCREDFFARLDADASGSRDVYA